MDDAFTLADDVVFIPVGEVAESFKQNFQHTETDVVMTRRNSRSRSKVLDQDAAALLKHFSTPTTWAEAILNHASRTNQDPQQLAEDAFALLLEMHEEEFLVCGNKAAAEKGPHVFAAGQPFGYYTIEAVCQVMDESAVYRAEAQDGQYYAIKIFRNEEPGKVPEAFENEKQVLQMLEGTVAPRLIDYGEQNDTCFLVMEWCNGVNCETAVVPYRNYNVRQNLLSVLDRCLAVLQAFQQLHKQGFLHGDVHPHNILIDENKTVKILDYAFASIPGKKERSIRVGIDLYYEPEMAAALLDQKSYPPVTEKSEQYALAALLYRMIAGHDYLRFSLEPPKAYEQILHQPPLPFSAFDLTLPPCFDAAFCKALAKDPSQRYDTLEDFSRAIDECREAVVGGFPFFTAGKKNAEENFVRTLIHKYGWDSAFMQNGLSVPPTCSVHDGAAGIAYLLYRVACVQEDADLLALADVWANRALDNTRSYANRFYTMDGGISEATAGRRSLYHSPTGVHLVQALVSSAKGDHIALQKAVHAYTNASQVSCNNLDLTTGKAGLLLGSALLLTQLNKRAGCDTAGLRRFTAQLMQELWLELDGYPIMTQPNPVDYFGIAHGWAGMIYATLKWCQASGNAAPDGVWLRINELTTKAISRNGNTSWPVSLSLNEQRPGWCHGNAGYVLFWSLLFDCSGNENFLQLAEQTGKRLLSVSQEVPHLCCGLAGQAYAFLRLHRLTKNSLYEKKLQQLRQVISAQLSSPLLRNNSLYKGEAGIGVLFAELQRPELARMPLFE